ncbi:MAG: adenylate/guanylate cyclase domain-containing protein [Ginsengibacter sp.]
MEQDIAILIADLSGYTALTETHGPSTAADMIDKYVAIVNDCLVGESKLHQSVGDEVLVVSTSPDQLINTAVMLIQKCSQEHNFLQVHGGLHYGKILKRNNNYFGSAINLTSRIAAKANQGTFWCSSHFVNALPDKTLFTFQSQGMHNFKNVSEENEMHELVIENTSAFHIDPVCRMLIHKKETAVRHPKEDIFFCSDGCRDIYLSGNTR